MAGTIRSRLSKLLKQAPAFESVAPPSPPLDRGSPFWFYNCLLDAEGTIRRYAQHDLEAHPDYLTNFLGVKVSPRYLHGAIDGREGHIEAPPLPASWHADLTEWAAALRSVDLSGPHYTMAELGCGWGCWMNNMGVAARQVGKTVELVGVEGDEAHVAYAHEALQLNGFSPREYTVHRGIAAATPGVALFPRQEFAGREYGLEPLFGVSAQKQAEAVQAGTHDALTMIPIKDLVPKVGKLDLLHVDIQGGEADLVEQSLKDLNASVAYLVIGTHSREIEGRLFATLRKAGWCLEIERPAYLHLDSQQGPIVKIDGAQGWRNTHLVP